jgi:sulfate adenylyltransferase subunit 2
VQDETGVGASRNRLQTTTLLDTIAANGFDAALGGARRDEERARAKERVDLGQWDPKGQRPELWNLCKSRAGCPVGKLRLGKGAVRPAGRFSSKRPA